MGHRLEVEAYHRPEDLGLAIDLLSKFEHNAQIIAGGTDLLPRRQGSMKICRSSTLVDLSQLGLNYIKKDDESIRIGAMTDMNRIATSSTFSPDPYSVLIEAALRHSTETIRNRATIGGSICNASNCADLVLPLLVLDSFLVVAGENGKKEIQLKDFFKGPNYTALKSTEILLEVVIPIRNAISGASFIKLNHHQTAIDLAIVNVATLVSVENDICTHARVALGGVGPISYRDFRVEALLENQSLNCELIRTAARAASEASAPIDDNRSTSTYRREMVAVLTENSLKKSRQRSQK